MSKLRYIEIGNAFKRWFRRYGDSRLEIDIKRFN
jgi:hypothetical protein